MDMKDRPRSANFSAEISFSSEDYVVLDVNLVRGRIRQTSNAKFDLFVSQDPLIQF